VTFVRLRAVDWIALVAALGLLGLLALASAQSLRSDVEDEERALEEPVGVAPWKAMA
jgi:hypothetical protein